jgi:hypothetical protein
MQILPSAVMVAPASARTWASAAHVFRRARAGHVARTLTFVGLVGLGQALALLAAHHHLVTAPYLLGGAAALAGLAGLFVGTVRFVQLLRPRAGRAAALGVAAAFYGLAAVSSHGDPAAMAVGLLPVALVATALARWR